MVENDKLVVDRNNNSSQNLAKSKTSNNNPKFFKLKKAILNKSEILVNLTISTNAGAIEYFISEARIAFTQLKQAFTKAPIFQYFNLKYHIQIETNKSGYAICKVFSQLNFDWVALDDSILTEYDFS